MQETIKNPRGGKRIGAGHPKTGVTQTRIGVAINNNLLPELNLCDNKNATINTALEKHFSNHQFKLGDLIIGKRDDFLTIQDEVSGEYWETTESVLRKLF